MRFLTAKNIVMAILCLQVTMTVTFSEAATTANATQIVAMPVSPAVAPMPAPAMESRELIELKEQNKIIKEYQEALLSTVYWALGAVLAMAAGLAGYNWWSNQKIYEADKARLKEEFSASINATNSRVELRLEEHRGSLSEALDVKLDALSGRISNEMIELRGLVDGIRKEMSARIDELKTDLSKHADTHGDLRKSIGLLEWELRGLEKHFWSSRSIHTNSFSSLVFAIKAAAKTQNNGLIEYSLDRLIEIIKETIIKENISITKFSMEQLKEALDIVAGLGLLPEKTAEIRNMIGQLKVDE